MKDRIKALVIFWLVSVSGAAHSSNDLLFDGGVEALIATKDSFIIKVSDQVTGGCLPNPNALKDKMEASLRRDGFSITSEESFFNNVILITAVGYPMNDISCAVSLDVVMAFSITVNVPFAYESYGDGQTMTNYLYPIHRGVLTGPKRKIQDSLEDSVTESAEKLFLEISRARDRIFNDYPAIKKKMIEVRSAN